MKYCINCGVEIMDETTVCNNCGGIQNPKDKKFSIVWLLLGCASPVVGLLLHMIWKSIRPKSSKNAGIGALLHVACLVVFFLMYALVIGLVSLYYWVI